MDPHKPARILARINTRILAERILTKIVTRILAGLGFVYPRRN